MKKHKEPGRRIIQIIGALFLAILIGFGCYLAHFYPAGETASETLSNPKESIIVTRDARDAIIFSPTEETEYGLIFYPGAKVDYIAYTPILAGLAEKGILCIAVKMPFHMAIFDIDAADGYEEQYPGVKHWYISGHSMGGAMAAEYVGDHADSFEGLLFLAAYSANDLSGTDLRVLSLYGSEDRVLNKKHYEENQVNLPTGWEEKIIEGGCHAYFGDYGPQFGDGTPTIAASTQWDWAVSSISEWVLK